MAFGAKSTMPPSLYLCLSFPEMTYDGKCLSLSLCAVHFAFSVMMTTCIKYKARMTCAMQFFYFLSSKELWETTINNTQDELF
jgi:hypothetical protein